MTTSLSKTMLQILNGQRRNGHGLTVVSGDHSWPVNRIWHTGLAINASEADRLPGAKVNICDGTTPLYQCLVVTVDLTEDEQLLEFKRMTPVQEHAPVDFVVSS